MIKTLASFAIAAVALITLSLAPASAAERASGQTFDIAMVDFPATVTPGSPFTGRLMINVHDTGSAERVQVQIQTWVESPFGRAYLSSETRSLKPGRTTAVRYNATMSSHTPSQFPAFTATFGVTVTIKTETLEASHDVQVVPLGWV